MTYTLADLNLMIPQIPIMTDYKSNGARVAVTTEDPDSSGGCGWNCFDGKSNTRWWAQTSPTTMKLYFDNPISSKVLQIISNATYGIKTVSIKTGVTQSSLQDHGTFFIDKGEGIVDVEFKNVRYIELYFNPTSSIGYMSVNKIQFYDGFIDKCLLEINSALYTITSTGLELVSQTAEGSLELYKTKGFVIKNINSTIQLDGKNIPVKDIIATYSHDFKIHILKI